MEDKSGKMRKSGHEYQKEKEAKQRKVTASLCSKITTFYLPQLISMGNSPTPSTSQESSEQLSDKHVESETCGSSEKSRRTHTNNKLRFRTSLVICGNCPENFEKKNRNEFDKVVKAANKFVSFMTLAIEEKINKDPSLDAEKLCIQTELPQKRIRPVKNVHGESVEDAFINSSVEEKFKIKVFYKLMDKINQSMNMRFSDQKDLYLDLACFDPRRFPLLKKDGIPNNALDKICSLIGDIDNAKLKVELISLINVWPEIKSKFHEQYEMQLESSNNESEASNTEVSEDEGKGPCNLGEKCNVYIKCVYTIIFDYNMYSVLYTQLYKVYKYLLTIPLTQVSCERAFSNLKLIKTRLRSTLSQLSQILNLFL